MTLLSLTDLCVDYGDARLALNRVNLSVGAGECVALVGPSGSGKSTMARAILGLLPKGVAARGAVAFEGRDLLQLDEAALRPLRGRRIGYVAQDPYQACDPLRPVHDHVADAWHAHGLGLPDGAVANGLETAGITETAQRMWQYPHQWSGGMLQRASIAAATAHNPSLLIADEPTSALDADRADAILDMLKQSGSGILLISHDLELVLRHADRIALLDAGRIVETGPATAFDLEKLTGPRAQSRPSAARRAANATPPLLTLAGVSRRFGAGRHNRTVLDNLDLAIAPGEIIGITGPSGCGKSTLLRLASGLDRPDSGAITRHAAIRAPGTVMPIFQDPVAGLNARWPIWKSLTEPLTAPHLPRLSGRERRARALSALAQVGLATLDPESRPGELSSGQCQRIAVSRALIAAPALLLADEPTSALDTVSKYQVLDLLTAASASGTAIVVVSHDRAMLEDIADRVLCYADGAFRPLDARPLQSPSAFHILVDAVPSPPPP
ncbi:ATP-binding cassette domain-containing protein [Devosia sp. 63-57]|uniref:ABC transporter ATP-binding protein n=1 Tax=Devosia sp. 63-57 TaxID=1895751 RepID=UPI00086A6E77|nr:ATP-binding cassette domain-containing protein [Devosia sp. 63-57]ODT48001.1 MAG: hypothetical protein ABS74_17550 [Pelagibacterium sp. SCN 63-126]ODU82574.1 MAG: hypothetical protein ABT14_16620 [Pelagibacterium sp. SCN 63-17]OJX42291.1 MAG: hypothetical protein BGO80_12300 [Devosia sp. 63-57]